ncbi:MAG: sigma-70 family RNA polymerase sigma factor [Candidatus Latescibacterota bacterium]|nr:sigma-70 family RNA polymerase sigma factor [Candidatus Latescibacterota bacterium]
MPTRQPQLEVYRAAEDTARRQVDADLISRLLDGDDSAFQQLVVEYHPLAYSLAFRVLSDRLDAEEVAQDAFVKIHTALAGFRGEASLKTWILRIVLRLSLNRRRNRSRTSWHRLGLGSGDGETTDMAARPSETPEAECISKDIHRIVRKQIDALPVSLRDVIILNSFEELGYEEIARVLEIPVGTVCSRIHTARRRLVSAFRQLELL